jgi:hypothetical protein
VIPDTLDGWTLDVVRTLVEQGVFETDRFDFKERLPHPKDDEGKRRLRRDVAAFANSHGGFLVFGVKDDKGLAAADRIVGLPATYDLPEHFGNYPSASEPTVEWTFKNNPPISVGADRVIHVVNVPASSRRPHGVFEDDRWWFCKRTNKGTEAISYAELRSLYVDAEQRRANLALFRAEVERIQELAQAQGDASHKGTSLFLGVRYNTSRIEGVLPLVFAVLSRNSWLVRHLNAVRNAAQEADAWLSGVSPFVPLNPWQQTELRRKVESDAARVAKAASDTLAVLNKVEE